MAKTPGGAAIDPGDLILGTAVDYAGVTRGKLVPADRLDAFAERGVGCSPTWLVFTAGQAIASTGDFTVAGDWRLRLDAKMLTPVDEGMFWGPASIHYQQGDRVAGCPRHVLERVVQEAGAAGCEARTGTELEFVLTRPDGSARELPGWLGYGARSLREAEPFARALVDYFSRAGLRFEQFHAEHGVDQFELSLEPADPVTTADRTVLARILISRAAARAGYGVSFSPMSFTGRAGNGAHLHLSLTRAGVPLFGGGDGAHGVTEAGGAAIAGILQALPELLAVYAGTPVSELRLHPGNASGSYACWGLENREAAVRLVQAADGRPETANIELKVIDAGANPYLAAAAMLSSALAGLTGGLPAPAAVDGDPGAPGLPCPPPNLHTPLPESLARLERSDFAARLLGAEALGGLVAVRRAELAATADLAADERTAYFRLAYSC
jgi:glutamine synthetase